ncbi:hypothetical protein MMC07_003095 [Pseudocyphellaria aurata]|nr:hypothetical protein [Pseudocyphellaria aurata]
MAEMAEMAEMAQMANDDTDGGLGGECGELKHTEQTGNAIISPQGAVEACNNVFPGVWSYPNHPVRPDRPTTPTTPITLSTQSDADWDGVVDGVVCGYPQEATLMKSAGEDIASSVPSIDFAMTFRRS